MEFRKILFLIRKDQLCSIHIEKLYSKGMSWSNGRSSSSSAFPTISLGLTILDEIFVHVIIFNSTIEVVTFRLHGWCMLGVFLLLAFTHLGHECQNLFVGWNRMCAQIRPWFILIQKSIGWMKSAPRLTPRKNPLYRKLRGGSNPHRWIMQDSEANTLLTELIQPLWKVWCSNLQTLGDSRGYLLTQLPLADTMVDLWRLVIGSKVNLIVSLGSDADESEVSSGTAV